MLFNSFLDEIEKIAARKLTRSQMLEVLDRLNPTEKSFNRLLTKNPDIDKVRRSYREALRMGDETLEVPLAERLRNYKEIKRTGQMPRIDDMTDYDFGVVAGEPSGLYMNLSDEAPVEMFSGGKVESLRRAVKNPKTRSNTDVLVPGRLRTERGLYFTPSRGSAKSYSEMSREVDRVVGTTGRPAILSAKLPRRRVITNAPDAAGATEAFITAKDLKKAKTKIGHLLLRAGDLEKAAADTRVLRRSLKKARATKHFGPRSENPAPQIGDGLAGYAASPKKTRAAIERRLERLDLLPQMRKFPPENIESHKQYLQQWIKDSKDPEAKRYLNEISGVYVNTDRLPNLAKQYGVTLKKKRDKKAFEAFIGAHEHAESKVKRKDITPDLFSHLGFDVVTNDHNIIVRLSGPGAKKAKEAANALRKQEFEFLRRVVRDRYGPRGEEFLRPDVKFPKAMKKDLQKAIRRNPKRFYEILADFDA